MSRSKYNHSTLSGLIDSDSDDNQFIDAMPTPDSAAENRVPAKKARGRPKAAPSKVTKTKAPARRLSGRLVAKAKASAPEPAKPTRKVLADKTNQQYASETEEIDEFEQNEDTEMADELDATVLAVKENKSTTVTKKPAAGRGRLAKGASTQNNKAVEIVIQDAPRVEARVTKKKGSTKRIAPASQSPEKVIHESQAPDMEFDDTYGDEEVVQATLKPVRSSARPQSTSRPRQHSVQRHRAGSASDTERSDPALRRRLGEVTKKFENLNVKYQDLREIGLKEAERNFERYRKQSEEKTAASEKLIASLKADVASQISLVKESRGLKKKLEAQSAEIVALKSQVASMTVSLSEAQADNKTLSTKLAANRTAAASVESANTKVPGSAAKANGSIRLMGSAEAAQLAQAAQLKEDLYSDLTGLIIRSVKRESEDDVYDCIQTGRNGTLHFKLAVANEKSAESYEDAQCVYTPQLDPSRDRALMELLPDYLIDEITFPRPHAANFYARVVKHLTGQA